MIKFPTLSKEEVTERTLYWVSTECPNGLNGVSGKMSEASISEFIKYVAGLKVKRCKKEFGGCNCGNKDVAEGMIPPNSRLLKLEDFY